MASQVEALGLSIQLYQPTISTAFFAGAPNTITMLPKGSKWRNYQDVLTSYEHSISADGGFDTMAFSASLSPEGIEGIIEWAVGAHVEVTDETLTIVWEGYVESVEMSLGGFQLALGPLSEIANRVSVIYQTIDTSVTPPTFGENLVTDIEEDDDSQRRYGLMETVISGGPGAEAKAEQYRDLWLERFAWPSTSQQITVGGGGSPTVRYNCSGYHRRSVWPYNNEAGSGTQTVSAKIADILDDDPNSILSSANAEIETNTLTVSEYEHDDRPAWDVLRELASLGSTTFDRTPIGIYENQKVIYASVPDDIDYYWEMRSGQGVRSYGGGPVRPWRVRPAKWLMVSDLLPGTEYPQTDSFAQDPRVMMIERVDFTAPNTLRLYAGQGYTIPGSLGRFGLDRVGA